MQPLFIRGPSATVRMMVLVAASITLMNVDHRWHSVDFVRSTLSSIIYPLQYVIDLPIQFYYWTDAALSTQQTLLEKNRELEERHLESRVQLQKLDIIEKENDRLRKLLSAIPKTTERLLIAEIINVDLDPYRQLILLNKGSSSDVYQGQPIIDALGIMGQVIHVGPLSSTAMLITDASHAIPVQINRTGLRAIAFGSGKIDQLNLKHLPHSVDIKVGDLLITSGLGGIFPPNFPVAIISKVEHPAGEPFSIIEAVPHAQLDKSREVLLVWRNKAEEITDAKKQNENKDETKDNEATDNKIKDRKESNEKNLTENTAPTPDRDDNE
ncbi:Rod shape-determining protein MreC [hydrothermal vent metagenome]|uniref:Cell shape-determining protein MreC n=1 Tax=hydrothermal vent metagenome TaxID=652676 RepID=A0A3B0W2M3_9ZZZZ